MDFVLARCEKHFITLIQPFFLVITYSTVPRAQKKKTNALQVPLPRRLSWPYVSDLQLI